MPIFKSTTAMDESITPDLQAYRVTQNDIVICGVSGQFLESNDVEQYAENLLSGVNEEKGLATNQTTGHGIQSFDWEDVEFVGVDTSKMAGMDLEARKLVVCAYDAIFDSGLSPAELVGSQTGVFIGTCSSETTDTGAQILDFNSTGRSYLADQICKVFKFTGSYFF